MRRHLTILFATAALIAIPSVAGAATVTSSQLVETPQAWDGVTVTFVGEAVGEAMARGDEVWLHLNDDSYAETSLAAGGTPGGYNSGQAVVASAEAAAAVTVFGDHRHRGDLVEVTGVFNAACAEHGGDMDLHVTTLRVLRPGAAIDEPSGQAGLTLLAAAVTAAAIAAAMLALRRREA